LLPLPIRAPEGITFTEHGKVLLMHARLVLNQLDHAHSDLERLRGRVEGRLMVGVTPWITLTFLAEAVRLVRTRMPDIRLELFEGLMAVAQPLLREGRIWLNKLLVERKRPVRCACDQLITPFPFR
jgi:DNA-binding transcriptional LysR family regulator